MLKGAAFLLFLLPWFSCHDHESELAMELQALQPGQEQVYVRLPRHLVSPNFLRYTQFNPDSKYDNYYAFGYLARNHVEALPAHYKRALSVIPKDVALSDFDTKTLEIKGEAAGALSLHSRTAGYHNYDALTRKLEAIHQSYPALTELSSIGRSVEGREIWMMKISRYAAQDDHRPKLLYIANMHGDEVVGRELMVYLIQMLTSQYKDSPRIASLVNNAQIYIVPSMNPDGFERGSRFNSRGSDLNRNFPDFLTDPKDLPQGRQVETQAIMRLHDQHHFVLALNFHGGAECVSLPWDTASNKDANKRFGDDPLLRALGRAYTKANPAMYNSHNFDKGLTYGYEWYRVTGGLQDWASYYRRSIHATIELSNAKWPSAQKLPEFWQLNQTAMLNYLEAGLTGFHLKVVDSKGQPLHQKVMIANQASTRTLEYDSGIVHRPALPVAQKVRIMAAGYVPQELDLTPWRFNGNYRTVTLQSQRR